MRYFHYKGISILTCLILFLAIFSACNKSVKSKAESLFFTQTQRQEIEKAVEQTMRNYNIPGVIVAVWESDKKPLLLSKGLADIDTGEPMQPFLNFRIASITKTFTATVILQLVDEGKLYLEDTLDSYVGNIENSHVITIRQLLNHSSGVFDFTKDNVFEYDYIHKPLKKYTPNELINITRLHKAEFYPGKKAKYSNTNYTLLGMIVKKITGSTIRQEVNRRIIARLGLKHTSFPISAKIPQNYSRGYINRQGALTDVTLSDPSAPWASGAMISNAHDLNIWLRALYKGTLLSDRMHKEHLTWVNTEQDNVKFGLGIMYLSGLIGHNGGILGYSIDSYYLPSKDASIIVMTNTGDGSSGHVATITKAVVNNLYPGELEKRIK